MSAKLQDTECLRDRVVTGLDLNRKTIYAFHSFLFYIIHYKNINEMPMDTLD